MLKMYLQLLLTLGSFMGFVVSSLWLMMTYIYASKIIAERGAVPVFNWALIAAVSVFLLVCIAAFIYGVAWVRATKAEEKEKMNRYRAVMYNKKEAEASY
ncbi:MAG: hypothetical protein NE327_11875 [Lentisphaeraceae bacterium]|nr:hypothetical protein [Lentisphaeraceae bacterium]